MYVKTVGPCNRSWVDALTLTNVLTAGTSAPVINFALTMKAHLVA